MTFSPPGVLLLKPSGSKNLNDYIYKTCETCEYIQHKYTMFQKTVYIAEVFLEVNCERHMIENGSVAQLACHQCHHFSDVINFQLLRNRHHLPFCLFCLTLFM